MATSAVSYHCSVDDKLDILSQIRDELDAEIPLSPDKRGEYGRQRISKTLRDYPRIQNKPISDRQVSHILYHVVFLYYYHIVKMIFR